ncbi:MAG: ATP-binding protein [Fibrobacterales bacterium]
MKWNKRLFGVPRVYDGADYRTRHLARLINIFSLGLFVVTPLIVIYYSIVSNSPDLSIFIPFIYGIVAILIMQWLLRIGKFKVTSYMFVIIPNVVAWLIIFMELNIGTDILSSADSFQFVLVFLFLSIFVNPIALFSILFYLANIGALVLYTKNAFTKGFLNERTAAEFLGDGILSIVLLYLVATAIYKLFNRALEKALEEQLKVQVLNEDLEEKVKQRTLALKEAQEKLVDAAHFKGRNEVVTSILHNQGNILNSLLVRAESLDDLLNNNSLQKLFQANELLKSHAGNLEDFILHNPKSKTLAEYYLSLDDSLQDELQVAQHSTQQIMSLLKTMKGVIEEQDRSRLSSYIREDITLRECVESVLDIHVFELEQRDIAYRIESSSDGIVALNMSSFTVIMNALIVNAMEALEGIAHDKSIMIDIEVIDASINTCVSDNGVGIDQEKLTTIFGLGYSTKERAGFGLHNAANIAHECKGTIEAKSEGTDRGTTICFSLPLIY